MRTAEDPVLLARLARDAVPLTVCPPSNVKPCVFPRREDRNPKALLDAGLKFTINADDCENST